MKDSIKLNEISYRTSHIIRDERLARSLTQIQLAEELGISQSALSKIENHTMIPNLLPWLKFCSTFELPANLPVDEKLYKVWLKDKDRDKEKAKKRSGSSPAKIRLQRSTFS